jgi:hypothetical protein
MKVRCLIVSELDEDWPCSTPGCEGRAIVPVWVCVDQALAATTKSSFRYELTDFENEQFRGIAAGKFVELLVEEIERGLDGIIRMRGEVSKFACDYNRRLSEVATKTGKAAL